LDVITAHQVGLSNASDPELLAWAAEQECIVVTHDRRTMPYHATSRITRAEKIAGIIIISRRLPVSQVINDLEIIVSCSDMAEWKNVIEYLPSSSGGLLKSMNVGNRSATISRPKKSE
jgi:hypothetical protein